MKKILILISAGLALAFAGCTSNQIDSTILGPTVTLTGNSTVDNANAARAVAAQIIKGAPSDAQIVTSLALASDPAIKPQIVAADQALNQFIASGSTDISQLQAYLNQSVPPQCQAVVDALLQKIVVNWQQFSTTYQGKLAANEVAADLLLFLKGIDQGLNAALAPPPATQ